MRRAGNLPHLPVITLESHQITAPGPYL